MITHYLKIAFRNLMKYKTQSVISILGLAVGFVCFAFATLWIHYETTYDSYHDGAERMYILFEKSVLDNTGYSTRSAYPLSTMLKEIFPEVEASCAFNRWADSEVKSKEGITVNVPMLMADSCFMNMFSVTLLSGNMDFMYADEKVALPQSVAQQLFGTTDALGQTVIINDQEKTVCAILADLEHSNLSFGYWTDGAYFRRWTDSWFNATFTTIIKLRPGVDPKDFQKKMQAYKSTDENHKSIAQYQLIPLTQYRYAPFNSEKSIQFNYLILFSVIGALVILCALFNYLSLFVTRLNMRLREISLRKVCGSSSYKLFVMFITEYLLVIFLAGFVGMMMAEISLPAFRKLSQVDGNIYGEFALYFIGIILFSVLLLIPFVRMTPRASLRRHKNVFRKTSIVFQLIIGILFIFCMSILMKQLYFLKDTDLGWERKNMAAFKHIYPNNQLEEIGAQIRQMSCTREVLTNHVGLLPKAAAMSYRFRDWEGKQDSIQEELDIECMLEGETLIRFYNLQLLEGEMLQADDTDKMIINESAAKALGLKDPIGKKIYGTAKAHPYTIIGLIKNFHTNPPTLPVQPLAFIGEKGGISNISLHGATVLVKYHEGKWQELKTKVDDLMASEYPEVKYEFVNVEELYEKYLQSENTLLKLLGFVAVVCLLTAVFGIFSLVALTCKQRQKEIAIRKINGATIKDILSAFAREYFWLLSLAAIMAFPVGYAVMKHWLESYVVQTAISGWIFVSIYAGAALVIAVSIGWRVWRAANENPAEVIKNE